MPVIKLYFNGSSMSWIFLYHQHDGDDDDDDEEDYDDDDDGDDYDIKTCKPADCFHKFWDSPPGFRTADAESSLQIL